MLLSSASGGVDVVARLRFRVSVDFIFSSSWLISPIFGWVSSLLSSPSSSGRTYNTFFSMEALGLCSYGLMSSSLTGDIEGVSKLPSTICGASWLSSGERTSCNYPVPLCLVKPTGALLWIYGVSGDGSRLIVTDLLFALFLLDIWFWFKLALVKLYSFFFSLELPPTSLGVGVGVSPLSDACIADLDISSLFIWTIIPSVLAIVPVLFIKSLISLDGTLVGPWNDVVRAVWAKLRLLSFLRPISRFLFDFMVCFRLSRFPLFSDISMESAKPFALLMPS